MELTQDNLLAIKGVVADAVREQNVELVRTVNGTVEKVTEHHLTLYGPDKASGLRLDQKALSARMDRADKRWYKLVGALTGIQLTFALVMTYGRKLLP